MNLIGNVLAILALIAGFLLAGMAFLEISVAFSPIGSTASAVQMTQIFTQGVFYGVMSAVAFLFTIAVAVNNVVSAIQENTEAVQGNNN